jgi:phosphohistidine phosphatase SixA
MITVLLVRHADIDLPPVSDDPPLNSAGWARAEALAHVAGAAGVTTLFTSSYTRTKQTLQPLATRLGLQPREAPELPALVGEVLSGPVGAVVLIAGHSNTVPAMVAAFGASSSIPVIDEHKFDNLFVVTVVKQGRAGLVHLRYGIRSA